MGQIDLQTVSERLQDANFKMTPQRSATVQVLIDLQTRSSSAETIYMLATEYNSNIGLATVYRTLELLTDLDIIKKHINDDSVALFSLKEQGRFYDYQLHCQKCSELFPVDEDLVGNFALLIQEHHGFKLNQSPIVFHGTCQLCLENSGNA